MRDDIGFNIKFCEEVEQYPCIYDNSRSDYCNRSSLNLAWQNIAQSLDNQKVADCKARWKNIRSRYTKYKKQTKLPSGSGAKKTKQYYLADHLHFLDTFLKSRQSKGNLTEDEAIQEEEHQSSEDELLDVGNVEEHDGTQDSVTSKSSSPLPHSHTEEQKDSGYRKRKITSTSLSDVNSSALHYFQTKQRLLTQTQQSTSTECDPDLAFLHSLLPDMKTMNGKQKRQFKMGVMTLADEILNDPGVSHESSSSSTNMSSATTFNYTN